MKILCRLITILLFTVSAFAEDGDAGDRKKIFDQCVEAMRDIYTQKSVKSGKDGLKVICTIMPAQDATAIGWEIENPDRRTLTIKSEDMRLYSGNREFMMIDTNDAVDILYRWTRESDTFTNGQEMWKSLQVAPNEEFEENLVYKSAFKFGDTAEADVSGVTYFTCRLRDLDNVTAEIKINGEDFKFTFDGGGP